jgi:long-subunit fatty acid transport protein
MPQLSPGDTVHAMSGRPTLWPAVIAAAARTASASPADDPTVGRAVFTGATVVSVTSIALDPAAIAGPSVFDKQANNVVYVGLTSTLDQVRIARTSLDVNTGAESPADTVRDVLISPGGDVGVIYHPTSNLALGAALRIPPGQQFLQDHYSLRYYTLGGYQRDIQASLALGYHLANPLWVGTSITIDDTLLRLRYARDTALEAGTNGVTSSCGNGPCGVENPAAAEVYDIKVREVGATPFAEGYIVNLGAMLRLAQNTWLAVAYHTPPGGATSIQNELDGTVTVVQPPRDGGATLHGAAVVFLSQPASVDAEFRTRIRDDLDLHAGGRWTNLSRESGYDVQLYGSTFAAANVPQWTERPRGFNDTVALWAGVEQVDTGERWRLGARLGFESAAIDDNQTTPITIAPASATLDVGVQLRVAPQIVVQLSYGLQIFPGVNVTASQFDPRDRIACVDGGYDYATPACASTRAGYAIPTADGDYSRLEHAVRLGVRYDLP